MGSDKTIVGDRADLGVSQSIIGVGTAQREGRRKGRLCTPEHSIVLDR